MKPDDLLKGAIGVVLVLAVGGAVLGFDPGPAINGVVTVVTWLLPGAIVGVIVGATVTAITKELPSGLLFGGATAIGLTIVLRIYFWVSMHTG